MLEITLQQPGDLTFGERDLPRPAPGQALVRVHRVGVCGTDIHAFGGRQPFFSYPRVLGHELGVEVVEIAPDAQENKRGIKVGDRCCVEPYLFCGHCIACRVGKTNCCENLQVLGVHADGGMREMFAVPVEILHRSDTLSFDQLALVETLCIGGHAIARAKPEVGENVLVVGAGPIGLSVMQFALAAQARVIAMDVSASRLQFCRETLGVQTTVDANSADIEAELRALCDGDLPTCILDATGFAPSMEACFERIAPGGRIVLVGLVQQSIRFEDPNFHRREITLLSSRNSTAVDFERTLSLIESGAIDTAPWITHRLPLKDVVANFEELIKTPGLIKAMIEN